VFCPLPLCCAFSSHRVTVSSWLTLMVGAVLCWSAGVATGKNSATLNGRCHSSVAVIPTLPLQKATSVARCHFRGSECQQPPPSAEGSLDGPLSLQCQ